MKLTAFLLLTGLFISTNSLVYSQTVNIKKAKEVAQNHLLSVGKNHLKSASLNRPKYQFSSLSVTSGSKDTLYFVLNDTINHSFVIVAGDKRSSPIIGYSLEGNYDLNNQPPAFVAWMENRKKELEYIKENNLQADSKISEQWDDLSSTNSEKTEATTFVEPLIKTKWDQGCYYNSMCPTDTESSYCGHVPTGCTITSMAQIMKYWNYPTNGTGSHSYSHPTYDNLSADFSATTYQWSQMPNLVTSQNDAVATLMYHCGVSLNTDYGPDGSSAFDPRDGLVEYFNYSSNALLINRNGFTTSEWINLLKSELDLRHPILYTGRSSLVGHSFICDGYQDVDYFHFNWGWGGSGDGYFYIGNLNPFGYNFMENQYALINILPGSMPDGYNGFILSSNALDVCTKGGTTSVDICSSENWTALSNQSWLSLSTNTGVSGKTKLTMTAAENLTGGNRSATVMISAVGFKDQSITVHQFTKVNVTPGGLYDLISKNATIITTLTLTGTIDARDFRTMRDAMPALTDVDLSEVKIVTYTGTEGPCSPENKTYPANEIPEFAFSITPFMGKNYLKSVILPTTIKSIGNCSFKNCDYLTKINIPSSVINIIWNAFGSCNALIYVDSANPSYSSIDGVLFDKNQTKIIHCPISKTGNYTIPSSVTSIIRFAFESCGKLSSLTIPSSVTTIEELAFTDCSASIVVEKNNLNFSAIDGVLFNKEQTDLRHCPISKTGNYIIPSSVISIGRYAFYSCSGLKNITIPLSVTSIKDYAFFNCLGLRTVIMSSSVTSIGVSAFYSCKGLLDLTIPFSVASIEQDAFGLCNNLRSIYCYIIFPINFNVYEVAFDNVNKKKCILYVPHGSKSAYQLANKWKDFTNIVEMPGIFISNNKISMGPEVSTVRVAISSSSAWTATSDQTWLTTKPSTGAAGTDTIIITTTENPTLAIRSATISISATGLTPQTIKVAQYGKVEVTAGNLKTILANQRYTITSLTLSGTIDARDFKTMRDEMPALTDIDLSRVKITYYYGNEGTIDTSNNLYPENSVPSSAFYNQNTAQGKSGLKSVVLPISVTTIGVFAFNSCTDLTTINIPLSVTSIEASAFNHCTGLSTINIPASVNSIAFSAFGYFNGKISVDENNLTYSAMGGVLFNKNRTALIQCPISKTEDYIIPSSVTFIKNDAFAFCRGLTKVTIPSTVTSIGNYAFYNCVNLSSIFTYAIIPINIDPSIDVFYSVDKNNCTLYVPFGSMAAYQEANQWKDFVNIIEIPNQAPIANAGPDQIIIEGKQVALDGTGSTDTEGNSLTYKWITPFGIILSSETVSTPSFTAPEVTTETNYTFSLNVSDGLLNSTADQVIITIVPNQAPTAHAGMNQTVFENSWITLDGSASSVSGNEEYTYFWTAPDGITLSSTTVAKPSFITPEVTTDTTYTFSLVVSDGYMNSTIDKIVISVINVDKSPYVKNPIKDISVDKTAPDQIIDLQTVFADYDLGDILSYNVTSNINEQVVTAKITGGSLTLSFSSENIGSSEIAIAATSKGKEVITKFNVEVKIPTGIVSFSDQKFKLYPNPTKGKIKLEFDQIPLSGIELTVTDLKGKMILKQIIRQHQDWIDLTGNKPGLYLLKTNDDQAKVQKIVLK